MATGTAALAMPALARHGLAQQTYTCRIAHTEGIGTPITNAFDAWAELAQREARTDPLFGQFGSVSPETDEMIAAIRALGSGLRRTA